MRGTDTVPDQNTVFRQLAQRLPQGRIDALVGAFDADKGVRRLSTADLLRALLFAQLSDARSLRDIEGVLHSQDARRYHSGLPRVRRSTLADATRQRPVGVFTGVLAELIPLVTSKTRRALGACVRLIDSTTLPLSRLRGIWSRFSARLCGVKAHVVLDPGANCPVYLGITAANVNDITAAKDMPIEPGATYVFDLGYYDYGWWAKLGAAQCRIVTRLRANTKLEVRKTLAVPAGAEHILSDHIGFLPERMARNRRNPMGQEAVREIKIRTETGKILRILTNDLDAPAREIADLYKQRWEIELFFRWIKQCLKLRHFFGVSENAVRIQITVALIAFVLVRLAHGAQTCVTSLTAFARLIRATIPHRSRLDQLRPTHPHDQRQPTQTIAQYALL